MKLKIQLVFFQMQDGIIRAIRGRLIEVYRDFVLIQSAGAEFWLYSEYDIVQCLSIGPKIAVLGMYESGGRLYPLAISEWFRIPLQEKAFDPIELARGDPVLSGELIRLNEEKNHLISEIINILNERADLDPVRQVVEGTSNAKCTQPSSSDAKNNKSEDSQTFFYE